MHPISCARPLPLVAPQICYAKIDLGPTASFADCSSDKFCRRGNVWADVLRVAIVPRCPSIAPSICCRTCLSVHAVCSLVPTVPYCLGSLAGIIYIYIYTYNIGRLTTGFFCTSLIYFYMYILLVPT